MPATYGPMRDADIEPLAEILSMAFASKTVDCATWITERLRPQNVRVLRQGHEVIGGLAVVPMAQWFGGKSVAMAGICGVAITPHHRSGQNAFTMMREMLLEQHAAGRPISTLYASTANLYRKLGYERSGLLCEFNMRTADLPEIKTEDGVTIRPAGERDADGEARSYERRARATNGYLDRAGYNWQRIRNPAFGSVRGFVADHDGVIEGSAYYQIDKIPNDDFQRASMTDLTMSSPEATRALCRFLSSLRSMVRQLQWFGSFDDPILHLFGNATYAGRVREEWMMRIVHLSNALVARGYPAGLRCELHLDVTDELIEANSGRWLMRVDDGKATVEPGGEGRLRMNVRALSMLYAGFQSASALRISGRLDGNDADCAAAEAVFSGPTPSMCDRF